MSSASLRQVFLSVKVSTELSVSERTFTSFVAAVDVSGLDFDEAIEQALAAWAQLKGGSNAC